MSKKRRATKEKVGMKLSDWVESEQSANHSKKDQAERRWRGGAQARGMQYQTFREVVSKSGQQKATF